MKKLLTTLLTAGVVALGTVGCKKEEKVDTGALQSAFASAPAGIKETVDKAVAAVNANDYKSAVSLLASVISKTNELGQAQIDAAGLAFTTANAILQTRGAEISAQESKANASTLQNQATGSQ